MGLLRVDLEDKYTRSDGRVFLNGTQALVRLALEQRRRDQAQGLNTAGYVTGYRGSPLGGMDREFGRAGAILQDHNVKFHPAVNEDLAATALWGSQQVGMFQGAKHDGVFGIWYGKGPGVDRSGDVFRHANMAGTAPNGGVLALAGDDPACKSSTVPSQSEHALIDANIPVFHPANLQEVMEYGLYGWAMSRFAGVWVGMKCITDNVDTSASIEIDPDWPDIILPEDFEMPPGGLHIRWPDPPPDQEVRLHRHKVYAALAFARANGLDKVVLDSPKPRFGIVSTGKSHLDVMQALDDLGIDDEAARAIGLRVMKVAMPWPLEKEGMRAFAEGLEEILVVEEKRAVIENQLKEQLYNWRADVRPKVVGKFDEHGEWILPSAGELTPARIARAIAKRLEPFHQSDSIETRLRFLDEKERQLTERQPGIQRIPYFCSGCPHSTSTKVPEGSRGVAGIGCHYMAIWMDRDTETFTHMGGEGANWIGQAPFTETEHVFVNIGDGTYFHSGILALRALVAAKVNITFKVLYNDAVAMTGGQPMDGPLDVARISRQAAAEGAQRIAVVTDEPGKYPSGTDFAPGTSIDHRHDLDRVQRELRNIKGVSVLIYDQTCAAEKRRRRKRGTFPNPPKRAFINDAVCEGCGDCGVASNCVSITPVETELGRKRAIDQSSCNKDFTCVDGFCPSFVTVHDAEPRKGEATQGLSADHPFPVLPDPDLPSTAEPYGMIVTGIGGTGVVTIGALIGMAAHMMGKGITVLDVAGLAQKNGTVFSHLRIADRQEDVHAVRIAAGGAELLLGCDMVTAAEFDTLAKLESGRSRAVVNGQRTMTAEFTQDPDLAFPEQKLHQAIEAAAGDGRAEFVDASRLGLALLGDAIAANVFLVGYAFQQGLVPVSAEALEAAIDLNGIAPAFNKQAFLWGRRAAHDPDAVARLVGPAPEDAAEPPKVEEFISRRITDLKAYQNAAYAERYRALVAKVREAEIRAAPGRDDLTQAVARGLFKLMAYKDEYEVARLYTDGRFKRVLAEKFEPGARLSFHLAPPLIAERDPASGHLRKREYGAWVMTAFRLLATLKGLRGTPFDPFGRSAERRRERELIGEYENVLAELLAGLDAGNHGLAADIASLPESMRGFGHVKDANVDQAQAREAELLQAFRNPNASVDAAE